MGDHELKVMPPLFAGIDARIANFLLVPTEPAICVGHILLLREWQPTWQDYTGRLAYRRVTYLLGGGDCAPGLLPGWCILGLT